MAAIAARVLDLIDAINDDAAHVSPANLARTPVVEQGIPEPK